MDTTCTQVVIKWQSTAGRASGWLHWRWRWLHWWADETNDCELKKPWVGSRRVGIDSVGLIGNAECRCSRCCHWLLWLFSLDEGGSMQRRLEESRLAGRISRGGRQKETEDGVKVEDQSGWVSGLAVDCCRLSAGVTLAPPGRGQFWRQTGLVRVEVRGSRSRSSSSSWRSSSKLCPVTVPRV